MRIVCVTILLVGKSIAKVRGQSGPGRKGNLMESWIKEAEIGSNHGKAMSAV